MKVTDVMLCGAVLYLCSLDQTCGLLGARRRSQPIRRARTITTSRRRSTPIRRTSTPIRRTPSDCTQKYTCTLKYLANSTIYSTNYAFIPAEARKVNLCQTGGIYCTYFKNCRLKYLSHDSKITDNLNDWLASRWGNVTTRPKPVSRQLCDSAPGGMTQKSTTMTLFASITIGLITGLCYLPR